MTHQQRWGVVCTTNASAHEILRFAAFHLDAGASRVHIFLDTRNPKAFKALKAHPNCRVTVCDDAYWRRHGGARPKKHQVRQSRNATFGYNRADGLDWVVHVDVDEFLVSDLSVADRLAALPGDCMTARVRPMEALALDADFGVPNAFKAFIPNGPTRSAFSKKLYPQFGEALNGGFVSHVAGKLFAKTGQENMFFRIHNTVVDGINNPTAHDLADIELAHCHAFNWSEWRDKHAFRHEVGSYRPDMAHGAVSLHDVFAALLQNEGDAGLRRFFDEVCADTPAHRDKLEAAGLLRLYELDLDAKMSNYFPGFTS